MKSGGRGRRDGLTPLRTGSDRFGGSVGRSRGAGWPEARGPPNLMKTIATSADTVVQNLK